MNVSPHHMAVSRDVAPPGECFSGLVKKVDEERAKSVKCPNAATAVEKEIRTVYDMVAHLSGRPLPCVNPNCPLPSDATQRAMQIHSQHHTLLAFIRCVVLFSIFHN